MRRRCAASPALTLCPAPLGVPLGCCCWRVPSGPLLARPQVAMSAVVIVSVDFFNPRAPFPRHPPPSPCRAPSRNWPPALLLWIHRVEIARSTLLLQVPLSKSDEPSAGFFESFVSIHYSIADDSTNRAVQRLGEREQPRTHSPLPLRPSVRGGSSGMMHVCCTHVAAHYPV